MFRAVKLKNLKLTVFSLVCTAMFVAACFFMLRAGAPDTVTVNGGDLSLSVEDDGEITDFLSACGYPDAVMLSEKTVTVPKNWNAFYEKYNELQRSQGFDLAPYKEKPARELVFDTSDGKNITILVCGERIAAAHICEPDGSGMLPLIIYTNIP